MQTNGSNPWRSSPSVTLLAASGFAAIALVCAFRPLRDFDLPWNLATGRFIWAAKSVPRVDPLAFTRGTLRYVEVAADLPLFGVFQLGGGLALQILGALAVLGLLLLVLCWLRGAGPVAHLAASAVAVAVVPWCEVRPATLSCVLLALTLLALHHHREEPKRWHWLALLVVTQWFWGNAHGFAALGAVAIAGYVAYRALARLAAGRLGAWLPERDGNEWLLSGALGLLAVGASCLNTAGPALLLGPFRFDEKFDNLTEWARPNLDYFVYQQPVGSVVLLLAVLAFVFGRESGGGRTPSLFAAVLGGCAVAGLFVAVRLLPLVALIVVPLGALRLAPLVRSSGLVSHASALGPLLAAAWLALSLKLSMTAGFDPTWLPVEATQYVERSAPVGRVYNFMPFGGYLAWRLHPRYHVFMDGRNQLARDGAFVARAALAGREPLVFDEVVDEYHLEWAMTRAADGESFDRPLASSRRWVMTYWDDVAAVYVRSDGPNRELALAGYQVLRHLTSPAQVLSMALTRPEFATALAEDAARAATQAPGSARAAFIEACGGLASRNSLVFERGLGRLARLSPEHPAIGVLIRAEGARRRELAGAGTPSPAAAELK